MLTLVLQSRTITDSEDGYSRASIGLRRTTMDSFRPDELIYGSVVAVTSLGGILL